MPWAAERIARSGLWQDFMGLPLYTWPPVVLGCPLTSPSDKLWVSLLSHLTLLCSPALAKSPKASDVLAPHIDPPLPKGFLLIWKLLHPPRGYGVGGELALEKTFYIPGKGGASLSLYPPS